MSDMCIIFKPLNDAGRLEKVSFLFSTLYLYLFPNPYKSVPNSPEPTPTPNQDRKIDLGIASPDCTPFPLAKSTALFPPHWSTLLRSSTKKNIEATILAMNKPTTIAKTYVRMNLGIDSKPTKGIKIKSSTATTEKDQ
jgi:hypothetical protein